MNLLDLAVKITCDDQASGQVGGIGSKITGALGTAAKVGGAAVAALGTATIAVGKSALDAFADYEQLVGGIDTLFKNSSAKVQQYAASAYQTAGVSANRYMEISTSFAASLISSLGGDTAAAADMANMAIMDMSDNANKMGTDLGVVQEAYQSLARGNYEMLDSLKLGYGGTKSELERLLSDAEQIAASQGMVRDFSVSSYADVVEAIHLVQGEMGITGTTAAEASATISGSINSAKAAWENWLAGLGNEDADMGALTDQLVQSVVTAGENIVPRMGQIMSTLVQTVVQYAPQLGQEIMNGLSRIDFAQVGQTASDLILMLVNGIVTNLPMLAQAALQIVMALGQGLVTNGPQILMQLGQLLLQLAQYVIANVPNILNAAMQFFGMILQGIVTYGPQILMTLIGLLGQLIGQVISWAGQMLANAVSAAANFLGGLMGGLASLPGQVASFLGSVISNVASWVGEMASNAVSAGQEFLNGISQGFNSAVEFVTGIPGKILGALGDLGGLLWDAGSQIIDGLLGGLKSAWDGVTGWFGEITSKIPNLKGPASVDAKLLTDNGELIIGGLLGGMERKWTDVERFLSSKTADMGASFGVYGGQFTMQGAALGVDDDAPMLARSTEDAMRGMVGSAASVRASSLTAGPSDPGYAELVGAVESLHADLGKIIRANAPTATPRQFNRMVRAAT